MWLDLLKMLLSSVLTRIVSWLRTARRWLWTHQRALPPWRAARRVSAWRCTNSPSPRSASSSSQWHTSLTPIFWYVFPPHGRFALSLLDFQPRGLASRAVWADCKEPTAGFPGWEECTDFHVWRDQRWEDLHHSRYKLNWIKIYMLKNVLFIKIIQCKTIKCWSPHWTSCCQTFPGTLKEPGFLPRVLDATFQHMQGRQYDCMDLKPHLRSAVRHLDPEQVKQERSAKAAILASVKEVRVHLLLSVSGLVRWVCCRVWTQRQQRFSQLWFKECENPRTIAGFEAWANSPVASPSSSTTCSQNGTNNC